LSGSGGLWLPLGQSPRVSALTERRYSTKAIFEAAASEVWCAAVAFYLGAGAGVLLLDAGPFAVSFFGLRLWYKLRQNVGFAAPVFWFFSVKRRGFWVGMGSAKPPLADGFLVLACSW